MLTEKQNCLITGSAKRIGRSIALMLARDGHNVCIHYNNSYDEANDLQQDLKQYPIKTTAIKADLEVEDDCKNLILKASEKIGKINLLINNASVFENDNIKKLSYTSFETHMKTNLYAPLILSSILAKNLHDNEKANIINILDQRLWRLTPNFLSYTLSKSALWTATQTLAQSLAPNIRVNAIAPGPTIKNARQSDSEFQNQINNIPLKKKVEPDEIANMVLFLINNPSITGQFMAIDAGQSLAWQTPDFINSKE